MRPLARPTPVDVADSNTAGDGAEAVTRALSALDDLELTKDGQVKVTLAALNGAEAPEPAFETDTQKVEDLIQTPDILAEDVATADQAAPALDIRRVTGTVVNMRDGPSTFYLTIGRLMQGDQVEVLENPGEGWLKIRTTATGQEGWMADWLVTAAAN